MMRGTLTNDCRIEPYGLEIGKRCLLVSRDSQSVTEKSFVFRNPHSDFNVYIHVR